MRESKNEQWDAIVTSCGSPDAEGFEEKGKAFLSEKMQAELKDRQQSRFPYVIVPGAISALNVNDKDGNGVYRIVVYKEQAEDVIKACRKL